MYTFELNFCVSYVSLTKQYSRTSSAYVDFILDLAKLEILSESVKFVGCATILCMNASNKKYQQVSQH